MLIIKFINTKKTPELHLNASTFVLFSWSTFWRSWNRKRNWNISMANLCLHLIAIIGALLSVCGNEDNVMRAGKDGAKARMPTEPDRISKTGIIALSFTAVSLAIAILIYCFFKNFKFCFSKRGTATLDVNDNRATNDAAETRQGNCCNHAPPPYPGFGMSSSNAEEAPPRYSSLFQPQDYV